MMALMPIYTCYYEHIRYKLHCYSYRYRWKVSWPSVDMLITQLGQHWRLHDTRCGDNDPECGAVEGSEQHTGTILTAPCTQLAVTLMTSRPRQYVIGPLRMFFINQPHLASVSAYSCCTTMARYWSNVEYMD